ncbi:TonB-dependent receptor [Rodentibacter pneumotropicus]|uniref:TonB-dependent receptor n=1 Tax=Rodentibacter pneumotropicus TaxID=758 RepID=UPI00035E3CAC|nr:TonB-dependent receptor [Rodentibacter pneumotropicus]NBH75811.1 TonB-dependent receptor [Rodentibacter pneumotropicus]OOF62360.1 ligand-gated channel protein [Rodentibacter pneumotropicus]THA03488.1 TonB-dependent receptor [Rodentibacter pneumotropicus]THA06412.1 TonB-dependent receptor [Rodentibacter pneumotropicus]THA10775.1 TonB-dependent receptor [Rodentibacter pneumotropicus]
MMFKHSILYSVLFTGISVSALAKTELQTDAGIDSEIVLDQVNVITELEKAKAAGEKQKEIVNLSLLGHQTAFTAPISVVNYDEKAFEDKSPRNVVDAISKIDPSVMNFGGETNTLSGLYIRNLQLDMRQVSVNGLAGLYSTYNSPTAAVSSAQLIKGASTATTGMDPEGSAGASMNIETKRATDDAINKLGFAWYSNNRLQETFDFGRRFGANNEWGVRVNGKYRDGDTPRRDYDERNKEFAIGADYRGDKLRIGIDYMYNKRATHGGRARLQDIQNLTYRLPSAPNGKTNLNPHWIGQTTEDQTIMGTFEYDLPYNMMLSGGIGYMESQYSGAFGQITRIQSNGDFDITGIRGIDFLSRTTSSNLKLQGELETGPLLHSWNLAFDNVMRERDHHQSSRTNGRISGGSIYQPNFSALSPNNFDLTANTQGTNNKLTARSLAVSDTMSIFDNTVRLTIGGRFQWIKQLDKTTGTELKSDRFSPMIALAYVPNPNLVIYGNYLEDLEPGKADPDTGEMNSPRVSRQLELGVRKNWSELLTTTLSIYEIRRPGIVRGQKNSALEAMSGKEQGKERNRGIEFNAYANLLEGTLRPSFGFTYNQAKLINFPTYADKIVNGIQVTSPRWIAKAAIEWDTPFIKNLTLNSAIQYYGKSYQDAAANYRLPSYTTVDFGAKYIVKVGEKQNVTLRAGIENAFNKYYWQVQRGLYDRSFAVLGMPRTYWANVEYSF